MDGDPLPPPPPPIDTSFRARLARVRASIARDWAALKVWLGPTADAVRGRIKWTDFVRIAIVALLTGGVTGLFQALVANLPTLFIDPADAGKATLILTALTAAFETWRRRRQGRPREKP